MSRIRVAHVRAENGQCVRVVTWHQPGPYGDWRGALSHAVIAADGTERVHLAGQAYATSQEAVLARCIAMARALLTPSATLH